jgi:hypothetical protein
MGFGQLERQGQSHSQKFYPNQGQYGIPMRASDVSLDYSVMAQDQYQNLPSFQMDPALANGGFGRFQPKAPLNYPMAGREPSKPPTQEEIIKRNIELLGGLDPSLDGKATLP